MHSSFRVRALLTRLVRIGLPGGASGLDICGPSIPRMLGLTGREVHQNGSGWSPVWLDENLGVMSIGFVLPGSDEAVIWRGPRKSGALCCVARRCVCGGGAYGGTGSARRALAPT